MKRLHVDLIATAVLLTVHAALEHGLADRDVVETLLSPNASTSALALLTAVVFVMSRVGVIVVLPAYWCFRGVSRLLALGDTAPDRQTASGACGPGPAD